MLRLAIQVARDEAEVVLAELLELAPAGVEEVDIDARTVEYALYGHPADLPTEAAIRTAAGPALIALDRQQVADDWADRWREFHKPLVLGSRLSVRPPWEPAQATELDLVIDPGRAFGTGAHATTRLCLEALLDLPLPRAAGSPTGHPQAESTESSSAESTETPGAQSIETPTDGPWGAVDLGCGSGVLGIAAARLGWRPVLALDDDQLAVDATRENAAVNDVADAITVRKFDLTREQVPAAPLVLANLLAPLLTEWVQKWGTERIFRPEVIILSGVLTTEADRVCRAFAGKNFEEERRLHLGEWAACVLRDIDTR